MSDERDPGEMRGAATPDMSDYYGTMGHFTAAGFELTLKGRAVLDEFKEAYRLHLRAIHRLWSPPSIGADEDELAKLLREADKMFRTWLSNFHPPPDEEDVRVSYDL